jgi:hypothetical protein
MTIFDSLVTHYGNTNSYDAILTSSNRKQSIGKAKADYFI